VGLALDGNFTLTHIGVGHGVLFRARTISVRVLIGATSTQAAGMRTRPVEERTELALT